MTSESPTGYDALIDDPSSRLGPVIINPGSGPVPGADEDNAHDNIAQFARDVTKQAEADIDVLWSVDQTTSDDDGRWGFELIANGRTCPVEMPGLKLESVRYLGREYGQNIWHYPRLYVDGSSWAWKYAVDAAVSKLFDERED